MKFVITGANSFLGQALCRYAVERRWEVVLVTRPGHEPAQLAPGTRVVSLAMADYARLGEETGPCDCLVCLAWNGTRGASRMDETRQRQNVEHSLAGIRSSLAAGCGRVVLAGSQAEYGPHAQIITENTECLPNTAYGRAKLELFRQASALCQQAGALLIEPRFFSLYGPGDSPETMVISTLERMRHNLPCNLTEGIQMWDFLHIQDAVAALARLCTEEVSGGVYNFGSGDTRQLRDYIREMAEVTGSGSELRFGAVPYPSSGMVSIWPDVSKLKQSLGWEPEISFAQGIRGIWNTLEDGKHS